MGNGVQRDLQQDPLLQAAKKIEAHLAKHPPKLRDVTITPLGGIGAHILAQINRKQPHQNDKTVSASARLDGSKIRLAHADQVVGKGVAPGTPDPSRPSTGNTTITRVENPLIEIDTKTGRLNGSLRLSIDDSQYPQGLVDPTVLQLHVSSDAPKLSIDSLQNPALRISTKYGPVHANFKLKLRYDMAELARAGLSDVANGGKPNQLIDKLSGPGFDLSGLVQFAIVKKIPVLRRILQTRISMSSPSLTRIDNPLSKAPVDFEMKYRLFGIVPIPAGAIFETQSLGYGLTGQSWKRSTGTAYSVAGLAVPSPTKWSEVSLYLYVNYYKVWRVGDGWEVSVDLNFSPSKVIGGAEKTEKDLQLQWQEASDRSWLQPSGDFAHADEKPILFGLAKLKYTFQ